MFKNLIHNKVAVFFAGIFLILLVSCSSVYNITDRSGNTFAVEDPELKGDLEYRAGSAVVELEVKDIVSLSVPNAEQRVFDGRTFYPASLKLEDSTSVPVQGFICVEGIITAKNAGRKFSIPLKDIRELNRLVKEDKKEKKTEAVAEEAATEAAEEEQKPEE